MKRWVSWERNSEKRLRQHGLSLKLESAHLPTVHPVSRRPEGKQRPASSKKRQLLSLLRYTCSLQSAYGRYPTENLQLLVKYSGPFLCTYICVLNILVVIIVFSDIIINFYRTPVNAWRLFTSWRRVGGISWSTTSRQWWWGCRRFPRWRQRWTCI